MGYVDIGEPQRVRGHPKTGCYPDDQRQPGPPDMQSKQQVDFAGNCPVFRRAVHINQLSVHQFVAVAKHFRHRPELGNGDFARLGGHRGNGSESCQYDTSNGGYAPAPAPPCRAAIRRCTCATRRAGAVIRR